MDKGYEALPAGGDLELARRLADGSSPASLALDDTLDVEDRRVMKAVADLKDDYASTSESGDAGSRLWAKVADATSASSPSAGTPPAPATTSGSADSVARPVVLRLVSLPAFRIAAAATVILFAVWTVLRPAQDAWSEVARATSETVEFSSPDGSRIVLRPNSVLTAGGTEGRSYRIEGEAFFDVAHDAARPFTVEAGITRVTVLGTRFDVSTWTEKPSVYLQEGRVRFEQSGTSDFVLLEPGQRATVAADGTVVRSDGMEDEALDWLSGALSFASRPFGEVARELEQHYGVSIVIPDDRSDDLLSGRIILGDLDAALADLGTVLGGRFVRAPDGTMHFE